MRVPDVHGRFARLLVCAAIGAFVLQVLDAIAAERALFADGAQFYIDWRTRPGLWPVANDDLHNRLLANALNQLPASVARAAGVSNEWPLRHLFGGTLFVLPMAILAWCWQLGRRAGDRHLGLVAGISMTAAVMPSQLFVINQAITGAALAWLLLHYQCLQLRWRWFDWGMVLVASLALLRAHEGAMLWGGVLLAVAVARGWREGWRSVPRQVLALGFVGLAALVYTRWWMVVHPVGGIVSDFLSLRSAATPVALWRGIARPSLLLLAVAPAALVVPYLPPERRQPDWIEPALRAALLTACLLTVVGAVSPWIDPAAVVPKHQLDLRFLVPFATAGFMLLGALPYVAPTPAPAPVARRAEVTLVFGVALLSAVSWQFATTAAWRRFDVSVRAVLAASAPGEVDPSLVHERLARLGAPEVSAFESTWAWSVLGLSRQNTHSVDRLIAPRAGLSRYRIPVSNSDSVRVPFVTLRPGGPFHYEALLAACREFRCRGSSSR